MTDDVKITATGGAIGPAIFVAVGVANARTMSRTTALRWRRAGHGDISTKDALQQGWLCRETGDIEWRDVESVYT